MNTDSSLHIKENTTTTSYKIHPLLGRRYSPFTFDSSSIKKEHLELIFEAGRWAPSAKNIQPWRFIHIDFHCDSYRKILENIGFENSRWASNAPVFIVAIAKKEGLDNATNFYAYHDLGLCVGMMTVQAEFLNIGFHQMGGNQLQQLHEVLKIPDGFDVVSVIAAGYYGGAIDALCEATQKEAATPRIRKSVTELVFKNTWDSNK